MPYVKLTVQSELPAEGEAKEFELGGKMICVANVNGTITAMDNVCLHMGGPLGQGYIEGNKLVCPWHGWEYDPKAAGDDFLKARPGFCWDSAPSLSEKAEG